MHREMRVSDEVAGHFGARDFRLTRHDFSRPRDERLFLRISRVNSIHSGIG